MVRLPTTLIAALLLLLVVFFDTARADSSLFIIQSKAIPLYDEARGGLIRALDQETEQSRGPKNISSQQVELIVLDQEKDQDLLRTRIGSAAPAALVAIGQAALGFAVTIKNFPIVYLLAPDTEQFFQQYKKVTGVNFEIPPAVQLTLMDRLFPGKPPILLHDAARNEDFASRTALAAKKMGVSLVTLSATTPRDVPRLLFSLTEKAGLFWIIPDATINTPDNIEQIVSVSLEKKFPVVTFNEKHLSRGAAVALFSPVTAIGAQAAGLVLRLAEHGFKKDLAPVNPNHIRVSYNRSILNKLGLRALPSLPPLITIDGNEVYIEMVFEP